jgi:hypothetical protein
VRGCYDADGMKSDITITNVMWEVTQCDRGGN